jgi:hypothetical protein
MHTFHDHALCCFPDMYLPPRVSAGRAGRCRAKKRANPIKTKGSKNKKPIALREPQARSAFNANKPPDITPYTLRSALRQGIIRVCSAPGFPGMLSVLLSPSVWGGLRQHSALPGILFCFASSRYYYISVSAGTQWFFCRNRIKVVWGYINERFA